MSTKATPPLRCVAIWIQLQPGQQLLGEGIGMHLSQLLTGITDHGGTKIVICAPAWSRKTIKDFLAMYALKGLVVEKYFGMAFGTRSAAMPTDSSPGFAAGLFALATSRLLQVLPPSFCVLLATTVMLPALMVYSVVKCVHKLFIPIVHAIPSALSRVGTWITYRAMAFYIDWSRTIQACIVPIGTWNESIRVKRKPLTVQIPDVVFLEFPDAFDQVKDVPVITKSILRVASHAARVVCPSNHVRDTHHIPLGISPRTSKVIRHAPMTCHQYLSNLSIDYQLSLKDTGIRVFQEFCDDTLYGAHFDHFLRPRPSKRYLRSVAPRLRRHNAIRSRLLSLENFGQSTNWLTSLSSRGLRDRPILYYPTQIRPYKNLMRVIEMLNKIRADDFGDPLLILTGNISTDPRLNELLKRYSLYPNVLCLPRLSARIHASVYCSATLTISASLFEGGFPFLFSESLSVNTPVIMADIPVVREIMPNDDQDMLFDPRDVDDLVRAARLGLSQTTRLLAAQLDVYRSHVACRTWSDVGLDYLAACAEGIDELRMRNKYNRDNMVEKLKAYSG